MQITPHVARRGTGHGSGLGVCRWVVEGALAVLHWFRRLRIRLEIRDDIHQAFVTVGCATICWRRLRGTRCSASLLPLDSSERVVPAVSASRASCQAESPG